MMRMRFWIASLWFVAAFLPGGAAAPTRDAPPYNPPSRAAGPTGEAGPTANGGPTRPAGPSDGPTGEAGPTANGGPTRAAGPTFANDIAPIVFAACVSCHRADGPAPFGLTDYQSVRRHASQIVTVTKSRFMPPWKADAAEDEFVGQRRLSDREIALIEEWVAGGAIEGDPRDTPRLPQRTGGWQLGTPDLVVTLPQPYVLKAEPTDVFRIFAIRLPVDKVRYVRGLEFLPGNPRVVHHANIRIDYTPATRQLDEADPAPGYDGLMPRSAVYPEGHFLGWTPGQIAPLVPGAFAWALQPGADLVVQLHMQPSGATEIVQPAIGLYFSNEAPTRTPSILRLGSQGIDIAPGDAHYTIDDSYVLPVDAELHAIQPHAHYRAREVTGTATLPDGTARRLIHIRDWDFRWQHVYRYVKPISLPKGTRLAMHYIYDNSPNNPRNPQVPPQRVLWGQRSVDEMGDLWFQLVTRDPRDVAPLVRETQHKMMLEDIIGYETMLRVNPSDAELHDDVALLYLGAGRHKEAVDHFRASVRVRPDSAAAHFNLATGLSMLGSLEEAIREYQAALSLRPDYANVHNNLGSVLLSIGRPDEALTHFREAVRLDSQNPQALRNLAWQLSTRGNATRRDQDEAVRLAERAVKLTGGRDAAMLDVLAAACASAGEYQRAAELVDAALALGPAEPLATDLRSRRTLYREGKPFRSRHE